MNPAPSLWKTIPSEWFDFQAIYDEAVATAPPHGVLVEVGSFWGQSAIYLAEAAKLADKDLRVYCVDSWTETPENNAPLFDISRADNHIEPRIHAEHHGSIFETFAYFLERTRLSPDPLRILRMDSLEAAHLITEALAPLHFVFLDGDHECDYVWDELMCYEPAIRRNGGIIAGHDYTEEFDGVRRAVTEFFNGNEVKIECGRSWVVRL